MLVALTGASGFLGGHTASALKRAGHRVRALVRSEDGRNKDRTDVDEWHVGDQYVPQAQVRLAAGAAALIQVAIDWEALNKGPLPNFERNMLGSLRLLESCRRAGVRQFLFVSSIEVYHEILPDRPLDETHPAWPGSLYGAYKSAFELHLKAYHAAYGMNTSDWRPASMHGIHPKPQQSLWFDLIKAVKAGGTLSAGGDGSVVHVEDVADALAMAVGDASVAGHLFNLVDCGMAWHEAAEFARQRIGSGATIEGSPTSGSAPCVDAAKARAFLDRHGNARALRRGGEGVKEYISELLAHVSV